MPWTLAHRNKGVATIILFLFFSSLNLFLSLDLSGMLAQLSIFVRKKRTEGNSRANDVDLLVASRSINDAFR